MQRYIMCLVALAVVVLPLAAQTDLTYDPSPLVFNAVPGQFDSKFLNVTNTGGVGRDYSLLTNPPVLLGDLVSYYPFDNGRVDLLTNWSGAVSGTYLGHDRLNRPLQAMGFDGVNDNYNTWDSNLSNAFSVSFWARPLRNQPMIAQGYYNAAQTADYLLWPDWYASGSEEGLGLALGKNGLMVINHAAAYMPVLLSYPADLSGWNHYVIVFSGQTPSLYVNGVLVSTGLPSPRPTTYLSSLYGGAAYGFYKGFLDDLCVYNAALTEAQIQASYQFTDMARFQIQPRMGALAAGTSTAVAVRMADASLAAGVYSDALTLCQMGGAPVTTPVPVVINVGDTTVPLAPADLAISYDGLGNALLQWSPVASATHYNVYSGPDPYHPEYFSYLGHTTSTSFSHAADADPPSSRRFFVVVAYLE